MKIIRTLLPVGICILIAISGCNLQKATPVVLETVKGGSGGGGGGGCPGGSPGGSVLTSPAMWAVVDSLTPALNWAYADPGCNPDGYEVHLRTGPFFADDLGGSSAVNSWSPASPLEPGSEYAWGVQAIDNAVTGPYAGENYFFTGPECGPDDLKAPVALSPLNNWTVDNLDDLSLTWDYPDACLPESYQVDLAPLLAFDGSPLNGSTGSPSTRWSPGQPLADCTRYYWRVGAVTGGNFGPHSLAYTFRVDLTGNCPAETSGLIQGTVWEDQCVSPVIPDPGNVPLGCVLNGDQIFTNQTYDPGEPGIPDLVVSLGQGDCPSEGLRDVPTGPDGAFNFYSISAGTYCVSISSTHPMNSPILLPGNWTFPNTAVNQLAARQPVLISHGQVASNVNFGWWYKFGLPWGSTNSAVFGLVWSDLCNYKQGDPVPDPLPAGCVSDEFGVHGDKVHQPGEPGIPGVIVDVGLGDCPSAGLTSVATDVNGYYFFSKLAPGKYCLRIDPAHSTVNEPILMPGQWTVIPSGHEGMTFRAITLTANHTLPGQDFGWDFDDVLVMQPPYLTLNINAFCRIGPGQQYESRLSGLVGQSFHIEAVSADDGWYLVQLDEINRCWMGGGTGIVTGDTSRLERVFFPTPTPRKPTKTPTATPTEIRYCAQFTDRRSCIAHGSAGCYWVAETVTPYCAGP